jgi:hypothetical protein
MQGGFGINMLAGMDWVRGPASGDGIFHLLSRVVVPADELKPVDDLDRVELLPDVISELGKVSQECRNEIRITKIRDVCQLIAARASGVSKPGRNDKDGMVTALSDNSFFLFQSLAEGSVRCDNKCPLNMIPIVTFNTLRDRIHASILV